MATAEKHKKRSQYRHFKSVPVGVFYWNAMNRKQIRENRARLEFADVTTEDDNNAPD